MECWLTDVTADYGVTYRVRAVLHQEKSPYQEIAVYDTDALGRVLTLDNIIMTSDRDEFVYHEMMAHVPLLTHPNPRRVLVIGGGDGGVVREALKHPIEKVRLVEIDERVTAVCRQFFPAIAGGLDDPRAEVTFADGIEHVRNHRGEYDVIIVDSTDPIGPAVGLFRAEFYRDVHDALAEDGLFVAQTESPFFNGDLIRDVQAALRGIFPIVRLYLCNVPTYPGGLWSISMGSKRHDPLTATLPPRAGALSTRYYSPDLHRAAFALPPFVRDIIR